MRYFKKIAGERLYLSPINPEDAEIYTKWVNDPETSGFLGCYSAMISLANEKSVLEKLASAEHNYAIVRTENNVLMGNISLTDIDHLGGSATFGIFIGEDENRSKGYGLEAIKLLLEYGFNTLNLHNIMLTTQSDNERGIACYLTAGFKEFGRRHEAVYKNGKLIDVVYMEILRSDFRA